MNTSVWSDFTRRTNEPKLSWLERVLDRNHIAHRRDGSSFHAPILQVKTEQLQDAWEVSLGRTVTACPQCGSFNTLPQGRSGTWTCLDCQFHAFPPGHLRTLDEVNDDHITFWSAEDWGDEDCEDDLDDCEEQEEEESEDDESFWDDIFLSD